jgi:drug/metabolite transporter (DMT)-like permease
VNALALTATALTVIIETAQQLAFKISSQPGSPKMLWTGIAVVLHVPHLLTWFYALTMLPLAIATPMLGAAYVTVPLAGQLIFKERVDKRRWLGICAIVIGLILVADATG